MASTVGNGRATGQRLEHNRYSIKSNATELNCERAISMELRQLRYFVQIVDLRSMGRAAAELEMATSTLRSMPS